MEYGPVLYIYVCLTISTFLNINTDVDTNVTREQTFNRMLVFAGICVESAGRAGDARRVPR